MKMEFYSSNYSAAIDSLNIMSKLGAKLMSIIMSKRKKCFTCYSSDAFCIYSRPSSYIHASIFYSYGELLNYSRPSSCIDFDFLLKQWATHLLTPQLMNLGIVNIVRISRLFTSFNKFLDHSLRTLALIFQRPLAIIFLSLLESPSSNHFNSTMLTISRANELQTTNPIKLYSAAEVD